MWQLLGIFLIICAIALALKVAIIVLLLAGLIFRTKETICLIILFAGWGLLNAHPAIGFSIIGITLVVVLVRWATREDGKEAPKLTDDSGT